MRTRVHTGRVDDRYHVLIDDDGAAVVDMQGNVDEPLPPMITAYRLNELARELAAAQAQVAALIQEAEAVAAPTDPPLTERYLLQYDALTAKAYIRDMETGACLRSFKDLVAHLNQEQQRVCAPVQPSTHTPARRVLAIKKEHDDDDCKTLLEGDSGHC